MRRFLLLLVLVAAAALPASSQYYELYIGTKAENGRVTNYKEVRDCDIIAASPNYHDGNLECVVYVKVANHTDVEEKATFDLNLITNGNVYNGSLVVFQACVGGVCKAPSPEATICIDVPAYSKTEGGPAEHIGFTAIDVTDAEAAAVEFKSECALTFTMGDVILNVPLLFYGTCAGVDTVVTDGLPAEYFNLQGMRVSAPVKGEVYIVRQGGKVAKTVMR